MYPGYWYAPDESRDSRGQPAKPAMCAGRRTKNSEAMPLSDLEMASTRRRPCGTRTAAGMSNTRTMVGDSAVRKPEKKETLRHGCCSTWQIMLITMSLTHATNGAEKARMWYWSRAVCADNAVSSGGTGVKSKRARHGLHRG